MTEPQLEQFKTVLAAALRLRIMSLDLFVRAYEQAVPLVDGDERYLRAARQTAARVEHACNVVLARLPDASAEQVAITFSDFLEGM